MAKIAEEEWRNALPRSIATTLAHLEKKLVHDQHVRATIRAAAVVHPSSARACSVSPSKQSGTLYVSPNTSDVVTSTPLPTQDPLLAAIERDGPLLSQVMQYRTQTQWLEEALGLAHSAQWETFYEQETQLRECLVTAQEDEWQQLFIQHCNKCVEEAKRRKATKTLEENKARMSELQDIIASLEKVNREKDNIIVQLRDEASQSHRIITALENKVKDSVRRNKGLERKLQQTKQSDAQHQLLLLEVQDSLTSLQTQHLAIVDAMASSPPPPVATSTDANSNEKSESQQHHQQQQQNMIQILQTRISTLQNSLEVAQSELASHNKDLEIIAAEKDVLLQQRNKANEVALSWERKFKEAHGRLTEAQAEVRRLRQDARDTAELARELGQVRGRLAALQHVHRQEQGPCTLSEQNHTGPLKSHALQDITSAVLQHENSTGFGIQHFSPNKASSTGALTSYVATSSDLSFLTHSSSPSVTQQGSRTDGTSAVMDRSRRNTQQYDNEFEEPSFISTVPEVQEHNTSLKGDL